MIWPIKKVANKSCLLIIGYPKAAILFVYLIQILSVSNK